MNFLPSGIIRLFFGKVEMGMGKLIGDYVRWRCGKPFSVSANFILFKAAHEAAASLPLQISHRFIKYAGSATLGHWGRFRTAAAKMPPRPKCFTEMFHRQDAVPRYRKSLSSRYGLFGHMIEYHVLAIAISTA